MAKVKVTLDKRKIERFQREATKKVARELPKIVVAEIERGISPVKGQGRFKRYSDSYRDQIREGSFPVTIQLCMSARKLSKPIITELRLTLPKTDFSSSPVNFRLTGDLLLPGNLPSLI